MLSRRSQGLADVEQIKTANIDITLTDHILLDLWKKFVLLSGPPHQRRNLAYDAILVILSRVSTRREVRRERV